MSKNVVEPETTQMTKQYGAYALHAGEARLHVCTCPRSRTSTRTHAHTHTQICNTSCFSAATMIRERASLLRYTCIACVVNSTKSDVRYFVI